MSLQSQIENMTNPQEFTRLYNAVLRARYSDDYLVIDDDRADSGNDGYLVSEKKMFAGHCFKRIQKQRIDTDILSKMRADLKKAVELRNRGDWDIETWTFISNHPISENVAKKITAEGKAYNILVSWRGADYLAETLQEYKHIKEVFPEFNINMVSSHLEHILRLVDKDYPYDPIDSVPRNTALQEQLLRDRPAGWEYLYSASILHIGKDLLEDRYRDHMLHYARSNGKSLNKMEALAFFDSLFIRLQRSTEGMVLIFEKDQQEKAFGPLGTPGDASQIKYYSQHILNAYEDMLSWAYNLRAYTYPDEFHELIEACAQMADQPLLEVREFIDNVVSNTDKIPAYFAEDKPKKKPLEIKLFLELTISPESLQRFHEEFDKARTAIE